MRRFTPTPNRVTISITVKTPVWQASFELEVILGDLDDPRFQKEMEQDGPMDVASPGFCQVVAKRLTQLTGRKWAAPRGSVSKPGFYVIPEYGLDPLQWPRGRLAGVELLTPPLPLEQADVVRTEIIKAIEEIDGSFNFLPGDVTSDCAWHINIDAGDAVSLDPEAYILGADELLLLLARNDRLFSQYAGLQRHAVGIAVLRHLQLDRDGSLLRSSGLPNLLHAHAGHGKRYAANFAKLERGYIELRHFSATSFFNGPSLVEQLERIPAALEIWFSQSGRLEEIFLRKFLILFEWLESMRARLQWEVGPFNFVHAEGRVLFEGGPIGTLLVNGPAELHLHGRKQYEYIASIREITLPDIAEAVALLALDLAELRNLGIRQNPSSSKSFQQAVSHLAALLKSDPTLSSDHQLAVVREAEIQRRREHEASPIGGDGPLLVPNQAE